MTLNSTGPISIGGSIIGQSIEEEYYSTAKSQLDLKTVATVAGLSTANISMNSFHSRSSRVSIPVVYSSSTTSPSITLTSLSGYIAGRTDITITINSGVTLNGNSSSSLAALTIAGAMTTGDTITLINNGSIVGYGGYGGQGSINGPSGSVSPGPDAVNNWYAGSGGVALYCVNLTVVTMSVTNNGVIQGGAGGGSGGGSVWYSGGPYYTGGGGGGGAGSPGGPAGDAGQSNQFIPIGFTQTAYGGSGTAGSLSSGGSGGSGYGGSGAGGAGGSYGAAGGAGSAATSGAAHFWYSGPGAGGAAVNGTSKISWAKTGTRYGTITG